MPSKHRILCLGESTTEGGYPKVLQEKLDLIHPGKYFVYDFGKTAVTSSYFKRNIESIIKAVKPHTVISMLGINDNFMLSQAISHKESWYHNSLTYRVLLLIQDYKKNSFELQALRLINANKRDYGFFILKTLYQFNKTLLPESYLFLADYYDQDKQDFKESLAILNAALEIYPKDQDIRFNRLWSLNEFPESKELLAKELQYFTQVESYFDDLADFYLNAVQDKKMALQFYEKSYTLKLLPPRKKVLYSNLLIAEGSPGLDQELLRGPKNIENNMISQTIERTRLTPSLVDNLSYVFERVGSASLNSIVMSYPLRSIIPTKEMLGANHLYLSNEEVFKKAISDLGYHVVFSDSFAGDFGHLTSKGQEILVDHLVKTFFKNASFKLKE